jgi:hypothetical protein
MIKNSYEKITYSYCMKKGVKENKGRVGNWKSEIQAGILSSIE